MKGKRRKIAAIFLAVLCLAITWPRTDVSWEPPATYDVIEVQGAGPSGTLGWMVGGVWEYRAPSMLFGGFSALVPLPDNRLMSFSDRGARFIFPEPDSDAIGYDLAQQGLAPEWIDEIADIEGADINPATGEYWLAMEGRHAVHKFTADHTPAGILDLSSEDQLTWTNNTGAEALVRLGDGRFVVLPEGRRVGLIFAGDPTQADEFETFAYLPPITGHAATDMAQLPDGRVLLLLRNLDWGSGGFPPFESKIAIGPAPESDGGVWKPQITLDLAGVIPRDNYEGIAVRELEDGRVAVWLIADDNLSVFQRNLVAKLILSPAVLAQ